MGSGSSRTNTIYGCNKLYPKTEVQLLELVYAKKPDLKTLYSLFRMNLFLLVAKSSDISTPIKIAMLERLLSKGADINFESADRKTAICYLCESGKDELDTIKFLVNNGATVSGERSFVKEAPFETACRYFRHSETISFLYNVSSKEIRNKGKEKYLRSLYNISTHTDISGSSVSTVMKIFKIPPINVLEFISKTVSHKLNYVEQDLITHFTRIGDFPLNEILSRIAIIFSDVDCVINRYLPKLYSNVVELIAQGVLTNEGDYHLEDHNETALAIITKIRNDAMTSELTNDEIIKIVLE